MPGSNLTPAPPAFWRDRPVLLTGGTGLLGGWLMKRLVAAGGSYGTPQMVQAPPPPPNTAPAAGAQGWQDALKRELAQCATQGFFERPSCSWNARNKYCAPNRAWGTMAECPARPQ